MLTQVEIAAQDAMLRFNNVKGACQELHISEARYYQILQNVVFKWKASFKTNEMERSFYQKAKARNNLLARHLTEVKRVVVSEPVPSQVAIEGEGQIGSSAELSQ